MKEINVAIVDDDGEFLSTVKMFFAGERGYNVVATARSGREGVDAILASSPDVVILDMTLPEMDGFEVMSEARLGGSRAKFIALSAIGEDEYALRAMRSGASHFMLKPISFLSLKNRIDEIVGVAATTVLLRPAQNRMLDERITNIFISVGIPAHIKGYQFLREAVKMAIEEPEIINSITKQLYPSIADRFATSASKVERAIRHAIEVAWNRGKIENINNVLASKYMTATKSQPMASLSP